MDVLDNEDGGEGSKGGNGQPHAKKEDRRVS